MIGAALFSILVNDPEVSKWIDNRIYGNEIPQGVDFPAVWYATDNIQPLNCRKPNGSVQGSFELGVVGYSYEELQPVLSAIRKVMNGFNGVAADFSLKIYPGVETPDGYNESQKLHQKGLEFRILGQQIITP